MNPVLETPGATALATQTQIPLPPNRRILVVEDDVAMRQANAQVLIRSGYCVEAAEDGAAGWEALHARNFDLLITDRDVPKLSGLELVRRLRRARMSLPVILASGSLRVSELDPHLWLQLAATLLKPFSPDQLLATVKRVLGMADRIDVGRINAGDVIIKAFKPTAPYTNWGINE